MDRLILKMHSQTLIKRKNKQQNKKTIYRHIKDQDTVKKIMCNQVNLLSANIAKIQIKKTKLSANIVIKGFDENLTH